MSESITNAYTPVYPESGNVPQPGTESAPVCWGAAEIGRVLGLTERQTRNLLERERIRSARRIGGKWFVSVRALKEEFGI